MLPVVERHVFASEWEQMEQRSVAGIAPQNIPLIFGMAQEDVVHHVRLDRRALVAGGDIADLDEGHYFA